MLKQNITLRYFQRVLTGKAGKMASRGKGKSAAQCDLRDMESLGESESFLDRVLDAVQDGISILDRDLNIIRVNRIMDEWYPHMVPLPGKKCYFAYHGRSEPCEICPSMRAIGQRAAQSDVVPFNGENGERKGWLDISAFPLKDERGEVCGVIEHVRDITGRKHVEEALRESEEKYRELVENANSIIIRWDLRGNLAFFNEFAERFFGYAKGEIIGKNVIGTIVPATDTSGRDLIAMIADIMQHPERYVSNVNENMRKNGERVWISWTNRPIRDEQGNVVEILSVGNDITERKQAEEALRESEEKFRVLAGTMPVAICMYQGERFIYTNTATERITGYARDELLNLKLWDLLPPGFREQLRGRWEDRGLGKPVPSRYEIQFRIKSGELRWIDVSMGSVNIKGVPAVFAAAIDITERKQAEDALRESEERLRLCVAAARLGTYDWDLMSDRHVWSPETYEIYGLPHDTSLTIDLIKRFIHPEDRQDDIIAAELDPVTSHDEYALEYRISRASDGATRWINTRTRVFFACEGAEHRAVRVLGAVQDVTERRLMEEELRESEEKFRFLVENSRDITWKIDLQGRWTFVSGNAEKVTGYRADENIGKSIRDVLAPESYALAMENLRRRLLGEEIPPYEVLIRNRDGHYTPFELLTAPIVDGEGKIVGVQGVGRDISYRKEAEAALRESEEKFRVLAGTSPAMIEVCQGDDIVYANKISTQLTGYTIDELLKMKFWEWVHPEYQRLVKEYGRAMQRGERVPSKYEIKSLTKGGETRWLEVTAGRIDYLGKPAGIATFFDITERKRAEEALNDAKAQAELYLDLMGHDINNMNQIALGYLELAMDNYPGVGQQEFLKRPIEVLQRSTLLIKNVRKLQRLQEVLQTTVVDVCLVLADIQREFGMPPNKAVTLNMNGHPHCHVRANELLQDVFANLVSNAIKHTGEHADITVDLDVIIEKGGRYCRVMVEDNGPGIPDDFKERIFNRLLRGTTQAKGMGLGLYLVKSLVDSYGGRVWVEDRVSGDYTKGARFVVMLPVAE